MNRALTTHERQMNSKVVENRRKGAEFQPVRLLPPGS